MAAKGLRTLTGESVSSLSLVRQKHPNLVKVDDQLVAGCCVVSIGDISGLDGLRVVVTTSPSKHIKGNKLLINSVHGYQSELPDRLEERNKLCVRLLSRRGDPVIRCKGGRRSQFCRDVLPELSLETVKLEEKKWRGSSEQHIEDMFANIKESKKRVKTECDLEESEVADTTAMAVQSTSMAKKRRSLQNDNPVKKLFEVQLKKKGCKGGSKSEVTVVSEDFVVKPQSKAREEAIDPKKADNYCRQESLSENSQTDSMDDVNDGEIVPTIHTTSKNVNKSNRAKSGQNSSVRRKRKPELKVKEEIIDGRHKNNARDSESTTSEVEERSDTLKKKLNESEEEDSEMVVPKPSQRFSRRRAKSQNEGSASPKSQMRPPKSATLGKGCGLKVQSTKSCSEDENKPASSIISTAPHVISDDSEESSTDGSRKLMKEVAPKRRSGRKRMNNAITKSRTASTRKDRQQKTVDAFFKKV